MVNLEEPVLTPVITDDGSEGYICDDCLIKEEAEQGHSLVIMWLAISGSFCVLGLYIGFIFVLTKSTALDFLQAASGYAGLGVMATVSVAATVVSEQAASARKASDRQASITTSVNPPSGDSLSYRSSRVPGVLNQRDRTERNRQNAALTGESIVIFTLGAFSAIFAVTLLGGIHAQKSSVYATILAFAIMLWISFDLARLLVGGQQTDPMAPLLQAGRLLSIYEKLKDLGQSPGEPSKTLSKWVSRLLVIWFVGAAIQWWATDNLWNSFMWEIPSLAITLILVFCALEAGRRNLFLDSRLWAWKLRRFTVSLVLVLGQCLSAIVGLSGGSLELAGPHAWVSWGTALAFWVLSTMILCYIAWGAVGYRRASVLSRYDAATFVLYTDKRNRPGNEASAQDTIKLPTTWCWLVLLFLLSLFQAAAAARVFEGPPPDWLLLWIYSLGVVPVAFGTLTLYLDGWPRRIFVSLSIIGVLGVTILWSWPTVEAHAYANLIVVIGLGLFFLYEILRTFGYPMGNNSGRIGKFRNIYRDWLIQKVYKSLDPVGATAQRTCTTPGCINSPGTQTQETETSPVQVVPSKAAGSKNLWGKLLVIGSSAVVSIGFAMAKVLIGRKKGQ